MNLTERLSEHVRACFTGIWVQSLEHHDAMTSIAKMCRDEGWNLASWEIEHGLQIEGERGQAGASDPLNAIRAVNGMAANDGTAILVLHNFHRFLQSAEIVQALSNQVVAGKQNRTILVVLAPVVDLPVELEKLFVVLEDDLPTREQLSEIASGIATMDGEMPTGQEHDRLLDASVGLTRFEAENAFSLSLVRQGRLTAPTLWEQKAQMLKKNGSLQLYRGGDDFSGLGGLAALKSFTKRLLSQPTRDDSRRRPRGVMLLSPPGCGKSQFCKSLGQEVGRPVLILDVGSLMGSLVGESEARTRQALKTIDAMAPAIVMVDEIEKAFAGVNGQNDSGVAARMFGTFLTWLNDHQSDVFVVCTANDVRKLPPEFARSERFDAVFFVDLPGQAERDCIWKMYLNFFELDPDQPRPNDKDFTGAEIKSCCRLAAMLDLPLVQAAENIVPVAVTAAESVENLRQWANGRCLSADQPGVYRYQPSGLGSMPAKLPKPSNN